MSDADVVKAYTGCDDDALISALLAESESRILSMTGRTRMIPPLSPAVRELAVCMYNRMGSEGMSSRSDGEVGISSSFQDIPDTVQQQIQRYRLARVGGAYYEAT